VSISGRCDDDDDDDSDDDLSWDDGDPCAGGLRYGVSKS